MIPITFISAFAHIVEKYGDNVAIVEAGHPVVTYRQLANQARSVATVLQQRGIATGDVVGIAIDKSAEYVCALLGIWYAGAAFVPMDPTLPFDRLDFMCDEAEVRAIITTSKHREAVAKLDCEIIDIDGIDENCEIPGAFSKPVVNLDDLAYVIFTSGSTGDPKGVLLTHNGIVPVLNAQISAFELDGNSRSLWYLSASFDASISDLGTALLSGASIYIEPSSRLQPGNGLEELMAEREITYIDIPPSMLRLLDPAALPPSLKTIVIGGEACALDVVRAFAAKVRLINVYGPTEATICTSLGVCDTNWSRALIGQPLPGITYKILDDKLKKCDAGVAGQLHIGGLALAQGYLNRPELTAAKFITHPKSGERLYCTGDLVMQTEDGEYQFLGRTDRQVKLRGMLVEPEEIEARLLEHPAVERAAVLKRSVKSDVAREILVAFVSGNPGADLSLLQLREHLAQSLPKWMVPQRLELVASMPLTNTGKIDMNALKQVALKLSTDGRGETNGSGNGEHSGSSDSPEPSETSEPLSARAEAVSKILKRAFAQVLGVDKVAIDDNFFEIGGDSFAVVEAVVVASAMGLALPPHLLMTHPTVGELSEALTRGDYGHSVTAAGGMTRADILADIALDEEFRSLISSAAQRPLLLEKTPAHVFITGATGFLGSRLLHELLKKTSARVYCLVRASSETAAMERLKMALAKHGLEFGDTEERVHPICGRLEKPCFGIPAVRFDDLAERVDTIYHCAAEVNNLASYEEMRGSNLVGTREVARLMASGRTKVMHYASTLSVFVATDKNSGRLLESDHLEDTGVVYGGYAQTKWAAEMLLRSLNEQAGPVTYHRFGLVTGDSTTGLDADNDFLALFVQGIISLGAAPENTKDVSVDITPIDFAARAMMALSLDAMRTGNFDTYHIANSESLSLSKLLRCISEEGIELRLLPVVEFQKLLLSRVAMLGAVESAACLALCRIAGDDFELFRTMDLFQATDVVFDMRNTKAILQPQEIVCPPPSDALIKVYLDHMLTWK